MRWAAWQSSNWIATSKLYPLLKAFMFQTYLSGHPIIRRRISIQFYRTITFQYHFSLLQSNHNRFYCMTSYATKPKKSLLQIRAHYKNLLLYAQIVWFCVSENISSTKCNSSESSDEILYSKWTFATMTHCYSPNVFVFKILGDYPTNDSGHTEGKLNGTEHLQTQWSNK